MSRTDAAAADSAAPHLDDGARRRFYAAALLGLHALEEREGTARRFGPDADSRWESFAGHLRLAHRIDLLLRDAAVKWGPAFSPAHVFELIGLAADEPFGPDWFPLDESEARRLWRETQTAGGLVDVARLLGVERTEVALPELAAASTVCVAGGAAVLSIATTFADRPDLSWSKQVLVVAKHPEVRQLGGLVAPLTGAQGATRLVSPDDDVAGRIKAAGFPRIAHAVVSEDADPAAISFARHAAGGD